MEEEQIQSLVKKSFDAKEYSYSPYSKFRVGAALLTEDGTVFSGCNVENASFGLTVCAERTAILKAVSEGHRKFKALAISSDLVDEISPCGACRQVMIEFGLDFDIYLTRADGSYVLMTPTQLLPLGFTPLQLTNSRKSTT